MRFTPLVYGVGWRLGFRWVQSWFTNQLIKRLDHQKMNIKAASRTGASGGPDSGLRPRPSVDHLQQSPVGPRSTLVHFFHADICLLNYSGG